MESNGLWSFVLPGLPSELTSIELDICESKQHKWVIQIRLHISSLAVLHAAA